MCAGCQTVWYCGEDCQWSGPARGTAARAALLERLGPARKGASPADVEVAVAHAVRSSHYTAAGGDASGAAALPHLARGGRVSGAAAQRAADVGVQWKGPASGTAARTALLERLGTATGPER